MSARFLTPDEYPEMFEKMCNGKERYTSYSAGNAAVKIFRKSNLTEDPGHLRAYLCRFGPDEHYHIGH